MGPLLVSVFTLLCYPASINGQILSCNIGRLVRTQKQDSLRHIFGLADPVLGHTGHYLLPETRRGLHDAFQHWCHNGTGAYRIDAHILVGIFKCGRFRQTNHTVLTGHIGRQPGETYQTGE